MKVVVRNKVIFQEYMCPASKMAEDLAAQRFIKPGSHKGKGLAVFTSGGDSQGKKSIN